MALKPRTFRRVVLVGSLAGVVLLVLLGYFVVRPMQAQRSLDSKRVDGMAAAQAGDHVAATKLLNAYIKRDENPEPEVILAYARARAKVQTSDGGYIRAATQRYRQYLKINTGDVVVSKELLPLFNMQGMSIEAVALAKAIRTEMNDSSLVVLREELLARMDLNENDPEIEPLFELALEDPQSKFVDVYQYIQWLSTQGRLEEARQMVDARLESNGNDADTQLGAFWLTIVDQATGGDQIPPDVLANDLARIVGIDPVTNKWETEPEFLTTESAAFIDRLFNGLGRPDLSLAVRLASITHVRDGNSLIWAARRLFWAQDFETLASLDPMNHKGEPIADVIGYQLLAMKDNGTEDQAEHTGIKLDEVVLDYRASAWQSFLKGYELLENDQVIEARAEFTKAIEKYPSEPTFNLFFGDLNMKQGRFGLAISSWEDSERMVDDSVGNVRWIEPSTRIINAYSSAGRLSEVVGRVDSLYERAPNNPTTTVIMIKSYASLARADSLDREKTLKVLGGFENAQANLQPAEIANIAPEIATLYASVAMIEQAKAILRVGFQSDKDSSVQLGMIEVDKRYSLGIAEELGVDTSSVVVASPQGALQLALAEYAQTQGVAQGLAIIDQAKEDRTDTDDFKWELITAQYLDITKDPRASEAWDAMRQEYPKNTELLYKIAESSSLEKDPDAVQEIIDEIVKLTATTGKVLPSRLRLAHARAIVGEKMIRSTRNQALEIIRSVVASEQQNTYARNMLGRLLAMEASPFLSDKDTFEPDVNEAIGQYITISRQLKGRSAQPYLLEAVDLAFESGDSDAAKQYLKEFDTRFYSDIYRLPAVAKRFENLNELDDAFAIYKRIYDGMNDENYRSLKVDAGLSMLNLVITQNKRSQARGLFDELKAEPVLNQAQILKLASLYVKYEFKPEGDMLAASGERYGLSPVDAKMVYAQHAKAFISGDAYVAALEEVTSLDPINIDAWRLLIHHAVDAEDFDRAQELIAQVSEHLPDNPELKGLALLASGELESASELIASSDAGDNPFLVEAASRVDEFVNAIDTEPRDVLVGMLVDMLDDFPAFNELQRFALNELRAQGVGPEQLAFFAGRAGRLLPTDSEILRIAGDAYIRSQNPTAAFEIAKLWRANALGSTEEADILAARALIDFERFADAASFVRPYVLSALETPDAPLKADVLLVYSRAMLLSGEDPELAASRLEPILATNELIRTQVWLNLAVYTVPTQAEALRWLDLAQSYSTSDDFETIGTAWVIAMNRFQDPSTPDAKRAVDLLGKAVSAAESPNPITMSFLARAYGLLAQSESESMPEIAHQHNLFAAKLLGEADKLDPSNLVYLARGAYFASLGLDYGLAESMYRQILSRGLTQSPFSASIQNNLAVILERHEPNPARLSEALNLVQQAIATDNRTIFWGTRGWIEFSGEDYQSSESSFRYVVEQDSTNLEGWVGLAIVLNAMGKDRESDANSAFEQVLKLTKSSPMNAELRKRLQQSGQTTWASVFTE